MELKYIVMHNKCKTSFSSKLKFDIFTEPVLKKLHIDWPLSWNCVYNICSIKGVFFSENDNNTFS